MVEKKKQRQSTGRARLGYARNPYLTCLEEKCGVEEETNQEGRVAEVIDPKSVKSRVDQIFKHQMGLITIQ